MSVIEVGEALRALKYRRGEFADERARMRFVAQVHSVLKPGSVSRLIFTATIVERVPYKMVARELAISLRQFFRLRNQMIDEIRGGLEIERVDVAEPANEDRVQLEIIRRFFEHGRTRAASEALDTLMKRSLRGAELIEAMVLQARGASDAGTPAVARERLEEASRIALRFTAAERIELEREIAMAWSYALYCDGSRDAAIEAGEKVLPVHAVVPCADPYKARKLARHGIFLAVQHEEGGSLDIALEYLRAAFIALGALERPPASEIAQIFVHRAFVRAGMTDEVAAAPRDATEAMRHAEWHGLCAELVWANLALAMAAYSSNPRDIAWPAATRAIQLAQEHLAGDPLARTLFLVSRYACAAGRPRDAVQAVLKAKPHVGNNNLLLSIYPLAEARAQHASGDAQSTIDAATRAIAMMEGRSSSHYIGLAYLKRGSARLSLGEQHVREDVDAALQYLERGAPLNDRLEALSLSASVTRNRIHIREADELRHLLSAAAG